MGPLGVLGNKGTRKIWQWEHGNKAKKIVGNKRTSNRLGNRGTNKKLQGPTFFYINVGVIEDFLLFSDFFRKFLLPPFVSDSSLVLALKSFFSNKCRPLV